jgi:hypothetical protein
MQPLYGVKYMNKPFLVEFQSTCLGDTIFTGPGLKELSKFYDIIFVGNKIFKPFFENWPFIKHFIWVDVLDDSSWWEIIGGNPKKSSQAAAVKEEIESIIGYTDRAFLRSLYTPTENQKKLEKYYSLPFLSTKVFTTPNNHSSVLKQLNAVLRNNEKIEEIVDTVQFIPTFFIEPSANKKQIVVGDGSWNDRTRTLHYSMLNLLCEHLTKKYINQGYEIVCIYDIMKEPHINKLPNVNYVCLNGDYESSVKIKNVFEAGVSLFIVPDSGLAYVALSCNIPIIWIESRIRAEWRIPPYYAKRGLATMWRKRNWSCHMNCSAGLYIKKYGIEQRIYPAQQASGDTAFHYKFLRCKEEVVVPCMNFNEQDIEELDVVIQTKLIYPC